jgi:nicotinate dehydrogenase subunit B
MTERFSMTRRGILKAGGALTLSFALPGIALAQDKPKLPGDLNTNRILGSWIRVHADGNVTLLIGKVELGQGTLTAAAQVAADELAIDIERIDIIAGDTFQSPNEGTTAGSQTAPNCLPAVHHAAAETREMLLKLAAEKLGEDVAALRIDNGMIVGATGNVGYGDLVAGLDLNVEATGQATLMPASAHRYIGQSITRLDIPAKMTGAPVFVQEMHPEGEVFGAIARPPAYTARLVEANLAAIEAMPGVLKVVRNGSFLGVIAAHQDQAWAAAAALASQATWDVPSVLPTHDKIFEWLETTPSEEKELVNTLTGATGVTTVEGVFHRPYHMHGSIGTSAAIAQLGDDGVMTIHTHSQSVNPTAVAIAKLLGVEEGKVRCIHTQGSGCYGHNMADDAAAEAALLARELPGRPVKLQYTRAEEHQWEPYGSAMTMKTTASVDAEGNIVSWDAHIWSTPHGTRPGGEPGRLLPGRFVEPAFEMPTPNDGGPPNYAAARNGLPDYVFPMRVSTHFIREMPVRVSSTRGLGAFANVVANEGMMDDLARAAGIDPVEFRLRHLTDPRARDVVAKCAEAFGWNDWQPSAGRGRGFGYAQYKNYAAMTAVAVEVEVVRRSGRIRIVRAVAANDCGHMVHPDNISNQIEGGLIQGMSWALKEEVRFDDTRILSQDWASYPILTFSEVPPVEVVLIDVPGAPYLGTGESSQGPGGAALANALADAVGKRVNRMPLTPDRVLAAMG